MKRRWYGLHPERVVRELKALSQRYHVKEVVFFDSLFFVNLERVKDILRAFLREQMEFRWFANAHVNQVVKFDDEMLGLLQATNCYGVELGIESGSQRMRDLFEKKFADDDIDRALEILSKAGISARANYIIAPPTEKKQEFLATVRSMTRVRQANQGNEVVMYQYTPIPGTPLERYEKEERKNRLPKTIEEWGTFCSQLMQGLTAPWLGRKDELNRQPILFYFKLAFVDAKRHRRRVRLPLLILQRISEFRLKREIFVLPVEWYLFRAFRYLSGRSLSELEY